MINNKYVAYTIIDEADYNDVVKTTIDGVRLLRTDCEEMYLCIEDIASIIPTASSALCVRDDREHVIDAAEYGWVRVKTTNNGYYCTNDKYRRSVTFVNSRLVTAYIRNVKRRKNLASRATVLSAILDAAVSVFDAEKQWVSFCVTSKNEYDNFTNKTKHTTEKYKERVGKKTAKAKSDITPVIKVSDMPSKPVDNKPSDKVRTIISKSNPVTTEALLKELSRVATSEGVEITITIKPVGIR